MVFAKAVKNFFFSFSSVQRGRFAYEHAYVECLVSECVCVCFCARILTLSRLTVLGKGH